MRTGPWWPPGRWRTRSWSPRSRSTNSRPIVGRTVTLHTLEYFDGNPAYGQMVPRLVGFLSETDKRFFVKYVSFQGSASPRACGACCCRWARSPGNRVARRPGLSDLPGIGRRTAEKIIAELCGKLDEFAVAAGGAAGGPNRNRRSRPRGVLCRSAFSGRRPWPASMPPTSGWARRPRSSTWCARRFIRGRPGARVGEIHVDIPDAASRGMRCGPSTLGAICTSASRRPAAAIAEASASTCGESGRTPLAVAGTGLATATKAGK